VCFGPIMRRGSRIGQSRNVARTGIVDAQSLRSRRAVTWLRHWPFWIVEGQASGRAARGRVKGVGHGSLLNGVVAPGLLGVHSTVVGSRRRRRLLRRSTGLSRRHSPTNPAAGVGRCCGRCESSFGRYGTARREPARSRLVGLDIRYTTQAGSPERNGTVDGAASNDCVAGERPPPRSRTQNGCRPPRGQGRAV
jgi:hypothetical protein